MNDLAGNNGGVQRDISLRDFFSVLFRRKWVILGVFTAALVVVVYLNATSEVEYESLSRVLVSRGQPESAFSSRLRVLTWEEELNSEIETITSGQIIQAAQQRLEDAGETDEDGQPIKISPGNVQAQTAGKAAVLYITYRSHDAKSARLGARAITEAYAAFRLRVRSVPEVEEFFRQEIENLREELDDWEQRKAAFMNEEDVVQIPDERGNLLAIRQQAEVDLTRLRASIAEEQAKVDVLRDQMLAGGDNGKTVYPFTETTNNDHLVFERLRAELVQEKSEYYKLAAQYTEEYPEVLASKRRVEMLENDLRDEAHSYIQHLEGRVEVFHAKEKALLGTISFVDGELATFPNKEAKIASFDRVLDQLSANYTALVNKQIQARIERSGTSDWNVLVLQPAGPAEPIRINDYVRMALIPLLSLLVGVALAFLFDGFDHSLKDASEVESHLQLPVLGSVGRLR